MLQEQRAITQLSHVVLKVWIALLLWFIAVATDRNPPWERSKRDYNGAPL